MEDNINQLITNIVARDLSTSEQIFNQIMGDKVQEKLEALRISVADKYFNNREVKGAGDQ